MKKFLLHVFVFCTILSSSVYAQREVQYYEFYDLLDFSLISAISIKYFRNLNEFIYQDKLVISGLRVQQTTGVVNVYKNKAIENFAQVSYILDSQKRVIKREHTESKGYSATANYTYFFDNFLMPATSSYVSSDLKWNFSETSEVKNDEIVFSRKESGSDLITYLTIKLDSQKGSLTLR